MWTLFSGSKYLASWFWICTHLNGSGPLPTWKQWQRQAQRVIWTSPQIKAVPHCHCKVFVIHLITYHHTHSLSTVPTVFFQGSCGFPHWIFLGYLHSALCTKPSQNCVLQLPQEMQTHYHDFWSFPEDLWDCRKGSLCTPHSILVPSVWTPGLPSAFSAFLVVVIAFSKSVLLPCDTLCPAQSSQVSCRILQTCIWLILNTPFFC